MKKIQTRTIAMSYPGFQALPLGVKRMLVVSESFFFDQRSKEDLAAKERKDRGTLINADGRGEKERPNAETLKTEKLKLIWGSGEG
jgi:hypothetical protein